MALPQPTIQYEPSQSGPLDQYSKVVSLRNALQAGQVQQAQMQDIQAQAQERQQQNQLRQQAMQDQGTIRQTLQQAQQQNPQATLADVLPSLQGKISQQSWQSAAEADQKLRTENQKLTDEELKTRQEQHAQYQQLYNGVMNLPDQQVLQSWPQIAQQIDSVPGNKIKLDPTKPMSKQQLQQFGPFLGLNDAYLQSEVAKRTAAAKATTAEQEAAKTTAEAQRVGKVPGTDVPFSPEVFAQKKALKPNLNMTAPNDLNNTVDAIQNGEAPPDITQYSFRDRTAIAGRLHAQGFDLAKATTDWKATQKYIATLNGSQQVRLQQALGALPPLADKIEGLYSEWEKLAPQSGFKVLNKATLTAMKNVPGRAGAVAQALDGQISDAVADLAVAYMGGNSPTDHGLSLAKQNLSADWNDQTFREGLKQLRENVKIRQNSVRNGAPMGTSGDNSYFQPKPADSSADPFAQFGGKAR